MKLVDVYTAPLGCGILYVHLQERLKEPGTNISHKAMPTYEEHTAFFNRRPYEGWYFIEENPGDLRGVCYMTRNNELGIHINRNHRGKGFAKQALKMLMEMHPPLPAIPGIRPGTHIARINPANTASKALFESLGFPCIEHTHARGE